jgi:hypothetical protein
MTNGWSELVMVAAPIERRDCCGFARSDQIGIQ